MARRTLNSSASKRKSSPTARRSRTTVARKRTVGATTSARSNVRGKARTAAKRGFAAMSPQRRRSIAAKGGRARAAA